MSNMNDLNKLTKQLYKMSNNRLTWSRPADVVAGHQVVKGKKVNGEWVRLPKDSAKRGKNKDKNGNFR